jgi:group I intron endonuclease
MHGFVYRTTNNVNGKKYVGRHVGDPEVDGHYLGSGVAIKAAIKKYGRNNFSRETLEVCETEELLLEREEFWITELNAVNDPDYYNINERSVGFSSIRSPEHCANISKAKIGKKRKPFTEEAKRNMGLASLGRKMCPEVVARRAETLRKTNALKRAAKLNRDQQGSSLSS